MAGGYSRSPKLVKGAFIELTRPFLGPVPNIILFQYNPDKIERTIQPWGARSKEEDLSTPDDAQPFDPVESFSLTLELDATDALEKPIAHPTAVVSGVADRIAALELLLYPTEESLVANVFGGRFAPRGKVPVVLFIWGPGRVVPVRLTKFNVNEEAFSQTLYPVRATVSIGLTVLNEESFKKRKKQGEELNICEKIAVKAYDFTRNQKELLARANMANSVESSLGQIPLPDLQNLF